MNENIDLTKILKDCPKGWKFWSPIFGEVEFERNYEDKGFITVSVFEDGTERSFTYDAKIRLGAIKSKEIMIYPSIYLSDWSKFKAPWYKKEKFDPKTLNMFDRVLGRDCDNHIWKCDLFSHITGQDYFPYKCVGKSYKYCIPCNDDTKHLVGKSVEAPEYYRYWED